MREEKQLLLDEVKEKIVTSKGFIITRYKGMTAGKTRAFRDLIAEAKGDFEIVKKRVFVKAAKAVGVQLNVDEYEGHIGVIFVNEDTAAISKTTVKYSEDNDKAVEVLGGQIEGQLYSAEDVEAYAKLPNLDEMRAQFLGLIEAPMAQTLATIQAILTSMMYCLDEKAKKSQE
jgi:large subunit ribosomal protein L10